MRKTIIEPEHGKQFDSFDSSDIIDQNQHSSGVVVELPGYKRVYLSGKGPFDAQKNLVGEDDIGVQTRATLENIQGYLNRFGGEMTDIVRVRVYVTDVAGSDFMTIHEVRSEFFDPEHFPASTLIEVADLAFEGMLIEIDCDAIIPEDSWDATAVH